jgi:hypothetical protein
MGWFPTEADFSGSPRKVNQRVGPWSRYLQELQPPPQPSGQSPCSFL